MREVVLKAVLLKLALDGIAGIACAVSNWAAALNHEGGNDSVESEAVIETGIGERNKVCNGAWRTIRIELHDDWGINPFYCDGGYGIGVYDFVCFLRYRDGAGKICCGIHKYRIAGCAEKS